MLFPDHGSALIPNTEDTPDEVEEWPANHAHSSLQWLQRASRQPQGQGGRERKNGEDQVHQAHLINTTLKQGSAQTTMDRKGFM